MIPRFPLCLLLAAALGTAHAAAPAKAARLANTVILDETAVKNLRLETVPAENQTFERTAFALGRIEVLPGKRAVLSSRIAGRAVQVMARPDHEVKEGDPLVVVESRQAGDPPPQVTLRAPMSGFVTELVVAPGEPVEPAKSLLAIVDLSTVYGLARVPEHLADQLLRGRQLRVRVPGWPGEVWETTIEHLGAEADPTTGTLEVACHLHNEGLWLRPGMRAEFTLVLGSRTDVMAVPRAALQGEPASRHVFIKDYELKNAFVKVPVVTGEQNDAFVEITNGLLPGDEVVTRGAYSLAFAGKGSVSLKEALDAAHGHPHKEDGSEVTQDKPEVSDGAHGHSHGPAGGSQFTPLTWFFAATSALLFALLVVALILRRKPAAEAGKGSNA
jgi:multidrug efflux pump subunit AcrA (membrane-fusion protein)